MNDIQKEIDNISFTINQVIEDNDFEDAESYKLKINCGYSISIEDFQEIIEGIITTLDNAYLNTDNKEKYYIVYNGMKIRIVYINSFTMSNTCWNGYYFIKFSYL